MRKFGLRTFKFWNKNKFLQAPAIVSDPKYYILSYYLKSITYSLLILTSLEALIRAGPYE